MASVQEQNMEKFDLKPETFKKHEEPFIIK